MRVARLYVILALAILGSCEEPATDDEATTSPTVDQQKRVENVKGSEEIVESEDYSDTLKIQDPLDPKNSQLPILPPIILLDFGNDADNSTSGEEKSKRTINNNLGYGFARNNLFNGRNNYYFPAGKSGTTVSIEESISPFEPKTIIETVKPISEKPYPGDQNNGYGENPLQQKNFRAVSGQRSNEQTVQSPNNQASGIRYPQPIFGQRTKLYKPSQIDYNAYQAFSSIPKSTIESYTTPRPDYRANAFAASQNTFVTPQPGFPSSTFTSGFHQGSRTTQRPFVSYSTTAPPSYVTPTSSPYRTINTGNSANSFGTPGPSFDGITTPGPSNLGSQAYSPESPLAPFSNLPRYTIENGVRYENKIVWKYSDGKISQTPPTSYINAYNEFLSKQNPGAAPSAPSYQNVGSGTSFPNSGTSGSYQSSGAGANYQNLASQTSFQKPNYPSQLVRYQSPQETRFTAESLGNIHSKSPAQFPNDQEPSRPARPSPFVSSASLQSANFGIGSRAPQATPASQGQSYELGYQGQYGLKTSLRSGTPPSVPSSNYAGLLKDNTKLLKDSYGLDYEEKRLIPKYAVNSPNPEYTYSTESSVKSSPPSSSNLFTPRGTLSPNVLSKYSTQAQKYLTKVFTSGRSTMGDYQSTAPSSSGQSYSTPSYINTNYENLLNYNPSISQYIRDPSSILKAQPTYIQAGNSLIPVIILRVDGAPPIQSKVTPNINLKALLQQYLTQYAGSIDKNRNNNFGNSRPYGKTSSAPQSPLYELTRLTQSLSQYSQDPSIANNFAKQFGGSLNQNAYQSFNSFPSRTSYDALEKTGVSSGLNNYGSRTNKPQKIKNVQIIEDPRFTSYKVNT